MGLLEIQKDVNKAVEANQLRGGSDFCGSRCPVSELIDICHRSIFQLSRATTQPYWDLGALSSPSHKLPRTLLYLCATIRLDTKQAFIVCDNQKFSDFDLASMDCYY